MSKSQRTKGASGEREVCAFLRDSLGIDVRRKLGQARDSGHDIDLPGFNVEVKRRKRIAGLYDWMDQCGMGSPSAKPVVVLRADGREWLVVMKLPDWVELAREEIAAPGMGTVEQMHKVDLTLKRLGDEG